MFSLCLSFPLQSSLPSHPAVSAKGVPSLSPLLSLLLSSPAMRFNYTFKNERGQFKEPERKIRHVLGAPWLVPFVCVEKKVSPVQSNSTYIYAALYCALYVRTYICLLTVSDDHTGGGGGEPTLKSA